jgi:hypothetical protein
MSILIIESSASVACIAGKARTSQPRPFGWHADFMTAEPGGKAAVAGVCLALLVGAVAAPSGGAAGLVLEVQEPQQGQLRDVPAGDRVVRRPRVAGHQFRAGDCAHAAAPDQVRVGQQISQEIGADPTR